MAEKLSGSGPCHLEKLWELHDGLEAEIVQLEGRRVEVLRKIRSGQGVGSGKLEVRSQKLEAGITLADMVDPVSCVEVGGVVRKRSDRVAEIMQRRGYVIIQKARTYYCQAKDAGALWGKFRRYWEVARVGESG